MSKDRKVKTSIRRPDPEWEERQRSVQEAWRRGRQAAKKSSSAAANRGRMYPGRGRTR
ncbi:hypothetical protein HNR21_001143 [Actinomadura cellulosilytica]|uniref:Uncharacterized protein n=1 Tax=Thermomonospora cellulosilytica TaxID=1411118 RepID=A0A7W3MUR1_9ACTN|nr:hypothetical protein [Thermomonospora cellulosilytica]